MNVFCLQTLSLFASFTLLQDLDRLLVHFDCLGSLDLLLLGALNLDGFLLHFLLSEELVLVGNESLDVTRLVFFIVLVDLVALRLTLGFITSRSLTANHAFVTDFLLFVDAWRKTALFKFLACLLLLSLAYLSFLAISLIINLALTLSHVDLGLIVLIVLVHDHVVVGDQQVSTLLIVELLDELIVSVVEVLRALHAITLDGLHLLAVRDRSRFLQAAALILCTAIFFFLFQNAVGYARILRRHIRLGSGLVDVHAGVLGTRLLDQLSLTLKEVVVVRASQAAAGRLAIALLRQPAKRVISIVDTRIIHKTSAATLLDVQVVGCGHVGTTVSCSLRRSAPLTSRTGVSMLINISEVIILGEVVVIVVLLLLLLVSLLSIS